MSKKIIIAGSRIIPDKEVVWSDLEFRVGIYGGLDQIEVVGGLAKGADQIGKEFADYYGFPFSGFPANWDLHGKSAGYIRNKEMSEYADELIAYWDGKSNGTKNMIALMGIARKPTTIIYV